MTYTHHIGGSLPPAALTNKATVTLFFDFFPPLHCEADCARVLSGRARKKTACPISIPNVLWFIPNHKILHSVMPCLHNNNICATPADSPHMVDCFKLWHDLKDCSHPFDALNWSFSSRSAIKHASSWSSGPEMGISLSRPRPYQVYTASSISENSAVLLLVFTCVLFEFLDDLFLGF